MQVFRFNGLPDKVLAFDSLPERLVSGFEMIKADGFPRHWKEWMGKKKRVIRIPQEKDFLTGNIRTFDPIIEEDSYFYYVNSLLNPSVEKWKEVQEFVKSHVNKEVRLRENLEDMAKPLAANKSDGISLEPEDVTIIPIPLEYQEKTSTLISDKGETLQPEKSLKYKKAPKEEIVCDVENCGKVFGSKPAIRMHKMKVHPKPDMTIRGNMQSEPVKTGEVSGVI